MQLQKAQLLQKGCVHSVIFKILLTHLTLFKVTIFSPNISKMVQDRATITTAH